MSNQILQPTSFSADEVTLRRWPRGLDHIVHAVRDLDAAAALYRGLGFTVGARNRHPWGTHNHIVQLPGCFIELLSVAEPSGIVPTRATAFSFGAFNRDFLARGAGPVDAGARRARGAADAAEFRDRRHRRFRSRIDFEREGKRPDGTAMKVAFSLAFARDPAAPRYRLLHLPAALSGKFLESGVPETCQWRDRRCRRRRRSRTSPQRIAISCESFRGQRRRRQRRRLQRSQRRAASIEVDDARRLSPPLRRRRRRMSARGAGLRRSALPSPMRACCRSAPELAGIAGLYAGNAAVIGADDAMGAVLVFEPCPLTGRRRRFMVAAREGIAS